MSITDVIRKSLNAIKDLDYPRYEVIILDNGSANGSFKAIKTHIRRIGLEI